MQRFPRLVVDNPRPLPAWVREPVPAPLTGARLAACWIGMVAGGWFMVAGLAWTARAICRVTGIIRP